MNIYHNSKEFEQIIIFIKYIQHQQIKFKYLYNIFNLLFIIINKLNKLLSFKDLLFYSDNITSEEV
jgi:hypothetical protein